VLAHLPIPLSCIARINQILKSRKLLAVTAKSTGGWVDSNQAAGRQAWALGGDQSIMGIPAKLNAGSERKPNGIPG
jgi:hypothetical protein